MATTQQLQRWLTSRLVAKVWWCGDDYCDCTKPLIERITPNHKGGYPWVHREAVWEGEFLTDTYSYDWEERERLQFGPLREACHRFGIGVPEELIQHLAGPVGKLP